MQHPLRGWESGVQRPRGPSRAGGGGGGSPEPPRWGRQRPREGTGSRGDGELGGGTGCEAGRPAPPPSPPAARRGPVSPHTPPGRTHLSRNELSGLEGPARADGGSWSRCPCRHSPQSRPASGPDVHVRHGHGPAGLSGLSAETWMPGDPLASCPNVLPSPVRTGVCSRPPRPPPAWAPAPRSVTPDPRGPAALSLVPQF